MSSECVKVMVRCRPMNGLEKQKQSNMCVQTDSKNSMVVLSESAQKNDDGGLAREFTYDNVYGVESTQREVFDQCAFPLVESVLKGYNGTIFAYGQTGCGKTHTMVGLKTPETQGIIPNSFEQIFGFIDDPSNNHKKFLVRCSYTEIYNEEIRDLLNTTSDAKLELKENKDKGVFVKDLTIMVVKSIKEIEDYMGMGNKQRHTGKTAMNAESSRSHSLFTIYIETAETVAGKQLFKAGKLNLVDLAGSERQSKTQAEGIRLKEATKINLSLSALGNVISALVDGKSSHIPYRDSKLTRLLQDSLGGNTKTVMIAAISPADYSYDETLSTLRYASRAKSIKNKPRVNEDPKDALLKQYEDEIQRLRALLAEQNDQAPKVQRQISNSPEPFKNVTPNVNNNLQLNKQRSTESQKEDTVEDLLAKLANKGTKVKVIDENVQKQTKAQEAKEKREIEDLQTLMKQMEDKLMQGGSVIADKEKENAHQKREMQLKLQEEIEKQQKLIEEKQKKDQELLEKEQQYGTLQEEVIAQRSIIKKLRVKYKQTERELRDQQKDKEGDRQELLDTIREQEKDLDFYKGIMQMMLKKSEVYKIKEKVEFDFEKNKWMVPPFILKAKEVAFPKIAFAGAMNLVEQSLDEREIVFNDERDGRPGKLDSRQGKQSKMLKFDRPSLSVAHDEPNKKRNQDSFNTDGLGRGMLSPFMAPAGAGTSMKKQMSVESDSMDDSYSAANIEHVDRSQRDEKEYVQSGAYEVQFSKKLQRNESDISVAWRGKYNSMERDDTGIISPQLKVANQQNIKLQPLTTQKRTLGRDQILFKDQIHQNHSESHPILKHNIADQRVKLQKIDHAPTSEYNLITNSFQNHAQSIIELNAVNDGKISAPLQSALNMRKPQLAPLSSNSSSIINLPAANLNRPTHVISKKNIRTLNPILK